MELGIDVGDLDRVIQIDSTTTVTSFLQRLGRTGRRAGGKQNCLFLATNPEAVLQAVAIVELWRQGQIEPLEPPPRPLHVVAQQIMAVSIQQRGVPKNSFKEWFGRTLQAMAIDNQTFAGILDHMLSQWEDSSGVFSASRILSVASADFVG